MTLYYDGGCSVCTSLAYKIHYLSDARVTVAPLASAGAKIALDRHYPKGWEWDFYLEQDGQFSKGLKALRGLRRILGTKKTLGLLKDYGVAMLGDGKACGTKEVAAVESRRAALKVAAMSPVFLAFSSLPDSIAPELPKLPQMAGGIQVHVAEVTGSNATAYKCDDCVKSAPPRRGSVTPPQRSLNETEPGAYLSDKTVPFGRGDETAHVLLHRTGVQFETSRADGSEHHRSDVLVHSGALLHPRFDLSVTTYDDNRGISMTASATFRLPSALVDYVVVTDAATAPDMRLRDYAVGVQALGALHSSYGRSEVGGVYIDLANALSALADQFAIAVVNSGRVIVGSKLVITSLPELMNFSQLPKHLRPTRKQHHLASAPSSNQIGAEAEAPDGSATTTTSADAVDEGPCGGSCCCGCGMCLSCGCGLGLCIQIPPGICGCGWCEVGCSCGCGYCCGVDMCDEEMN